MNFHGQRVTIMGLGHFGGGTAAALWLARQGAIVTVTDLADETVLAAALATLQSEPIAEFHLGGHREDDFRHADLVVVNPAVRPGNRFLEIARQSGARLASEIELFMEACSARMIGVTGSNGKSTTAAMTAAILRAAGTRTWLGGNLGGSLLPKLGEIGDSDWVVLELSSFQLWHISPSARMPHIAVVTNCTPNHLDWHGSFAHYAAAKQRILAGQTPADLAVLNLHDPEVNSWTPLVRGRLVPLPTLTDGEDRGTCSERREDAPSPPRPVTLSPVPRPPSSVSLPSLSLPGEHNRRNAACAAAAALGAGCDAPATEEGLKNFRGLPQRLEWFAMVEGRRFYNDSTATTPESTIAALESLDLPVWLMAGGRDKGFAFGDLAETIVRRARGAALFGTVCQRLREEVEKRDPRFVCTTTETMADALHWCWQRSRPGEAVVLSPGCASTDQFRNFRQRGERFVELVDALANRPDR